MDFYSVDLRPGFDGINEVTCKRKSAYSAIGSLFKKIEQAEVLELRVFMEVV